MKKIALSAILVLLMITVCTSAFALPKPCTAHYPRGGMLTLSPAKETNNTYAFKATGRADRRVQLHIGGAYADVCGTDVTIQMFVINKWGNWIAFGSPEVVTLNCEPLSKDLYFSIRERRPFCIVVSAYGLEGSCTIPYQVATM